MPKVLLVEDDPLQLRIREAILSSAGFQVLSATSADRALPLLYSQDHSGAVSIVITDHLLPGMSGLEFVRKIREFSSTLPVVVLSGLPDAHTEYDGLNIVFRQKPCPPPEIISLVQHSLNNAA